MGQTRPLFVFFIWQYSTVLGTNDKSRWCAWGSNPGRLDGRRRRILWAMMAPMLVIVCAVPGKDIAYNLLIMVVYLVPTRRMSYLNPWIVRNTHIGIYWIVLTSFLIARSIITSSKALITAKFSRIRNRPNTSRGWSSTSRGTWSCTGANGPYSQPCSGMF